MTTDVDLLAKQVGYLMERTAISDLLIAFARAIDTKDWNGYANLFTEDGIIEIPVKLPDGTYVRHVGRKGLAEFVAGDARRPGLGRFVYTHHLSSNHQIRIEGDTATTTSYAQCIHRLSDDPADVWELGGWYSCSLRKIAAGDWKFAKVHLDMVWEHGKPAAHG
jgi:ketosteroid isomerase-like protein